VDQERTIRWNFSEQEDGGSPVYVIRHGARVVGRVRSKGDADMICRARDANARQAMQSSFLIRQHHQKLRVFQEDIRILMATLETLAAALRHKARPREVLAARELARKVLRQMRGQGYRS